MTFTEGFLSYIEKSGASQKDKGDVSKELRKANQKPSFAKNVHRILGRRRGGNRRVRK